jgi:YVTN family beta-propeller protein
MNRFVMVWRMDKRSRLIAMIVVSIAILFLTFGLPVTANGSQNSGQNNPGGYVKYTLDLINNTLINGNFVNTHNALGPWGIAYDPSNGYLYVTDSFSHTVSVIKGTTVITNITVGSGPEGIAYDPSNGYIYVADSNSSTVSVIKGTTVITNITVGSLPVGVAYDPSNGYIYVTNFASGTVSIISTSVSTSSTSISSVTTPTTSTSTKPTPTLVPTLVVVVVVVVVVLIVALLMIKRRKP